MNFKKLLIFSIIIYIINTLFSYNNSMEKRKKNSTIKNIVFDLNGVLFETSKIKIFRNPINFLYLTEFFLKNIFINKTKNYNIETEFFNAMESIQIPIKENELPTSYHKNKPIPKVLSAYLIGKYSSKEINSLIKQAIKKNNLKISRFIKFLLKRTFSPKFLINSIVVIKKTLNLVKLLKSNNYKCYIISNWDKESFKLLQTKYAKIFSLFDGIIISGEEKLIKPDPKIFKLLLEKYNLSASESLFIDDEKENIKSAKKLGFNAILFDQNDKAIYKTIIELLKIKKC